jgi:hypothetical protein
MVSTIEAVYKKQDLKFTDETIYVNDVRKLITIREQIVTNTIAVSGEYFIGLNADKNLLSGVSVYNQTGDFFLTPELIIVVVNDGIMEISENKMSARIGYINQEDVVSVRRDGEITPLTFHSQLAGAGIFDFFKKAVSKVGDVVNVGKDIYDIGKKVGVIGGSNKKKVKK